MTVCCGVIKARNRRRFHYALQLISTFEAAAPSIRCYLDTVDPMPSSNFRSHATRERHAISIASHLLSSGNFPMLPKTVQNWYPRAGRAGLSSPPTIRSYPRLWYRWISHSLRISYRFLPSHERTNSVHPLAVQASFCFFRLSSISIRRALSVCHKTFPIQFLHPSLSNEVILYIKRILIHRRTSFKSCTCFLDYLPSIIIASK